ncbi:g5029 [Coccomyxa elongata]
MPLGSPVVAAVWPPGLHAQRRYKSTFLPSVPSSVTSETPLPLPSSSSAASSPSNSLSSLLEDSVADARVRPSSASL